MRNWSPFPKGTKFSTEHREALSAAFRASPHHKSKHQNGEDNPNFKGGYLDKHGYRLFKVDGKDVPEHRLIMEKMIGRKLYPHETVHHKNGQRADNREENLELWSTRNPKGQRVQDKIDFARALLKEYSVATGTPMFTAQDVAAGLVLG